ncbi:hypothetical protein [Sphingobacterium haloxyli]|uniref:DUF2158 domain-containing protein n=1 Tax=Sphingobacterium haloxyli TaxID=2100533 RepID=A0A2S9J717_9SPHI|nr:hypothetical protein [Sphingobacterium haloxyli]PRD48529.1 hypothetical protein C5745_04830 [Sphingobacterium haloxyli]
MEEFKIGDEIFHKSNPSVKWVIESIDGEQVACSTVLKETLEQRKEVFVTTSIKKCADPKTTFININKRDNYW